mmetsp:Transcript_18411/g.46234  ORF Transcript_18411/g.46234 Transcript_18411/m.46234 type:complete len:213 (-) Transcript_18411:1383-2021(-)
MPDLLGPLVSAGGVLLALNLKSLPLAYHARFIAETAKTYMENRKKPANIDQLFAVHSTSFRVFFDDLDYNLHMNNSCYHKYADYGRVSYATVTKMERCLTDGVNFICAGSIARHERALSPLQRFTLSTRLVEYDDKCIRLLQVFHPGKSHYVPCSSVSTLHYSHVCTPSYFIHFTPICYTTTSHADTHHSLFCFSSLLFTHSSQANTMGVVT